LTRDLTLFLISFLFLLNFLCIIMCLSLFQQLFEKHGSLPDDLSCKNIYTLLFSVPRAAPGCATFWESVVGHPINRWASVWRKSRLKIIENKKNDLLWLLCDFGRLGRT